MAGPDSAGDDLVSGPAMSEATDRAVTQAAASREGSELRYGIVGTGYFGMALGRAFAALPGARITRVYDPEHAGAAVEAFGAVATDSVRTLCEADDVDVVVVASPNGMHREAVVLAAQAGKHIFCEKPIALSYADCTAMVAAAADAGVLFMAGHVMNFMAGVRRAKRLIAEGRLGRVLYCRAVRTGWEDPQPSVSWKKQRALSGGHLYHHIHELDVVQFLMGPAQAATMIGGNVAHRGAEFGDQDDLLLITLEFAGDTFASMEYGSAFRWAEHHVLVEGELGAVMIDLQHPGVTVRIGGVEEKYLLHRTAEEDARRAADYTDGETDGGITYGAPSTIPPLWLEGIVDEETRYFDGLLRGAVPDPEFAALTDGSAARAAIATADALTRSLAEGRTVAVAEITG